MFGSFEKFMCLFIAALFGLYAAMDHYCPFLLYPELRGALAEFSTISHVSPRQGKVIPVSEYSAYLSNPSGYRKISLTPTEIVEMANSPQYDPSKINHFAQGADGRHYPANAYFRDFVPFRTQKKWLPLLALSLRVRYVRDDALIKDNDIWQTSVQTYTLMRGDCEDQAILLADWMIGLGYDARVVVGVVDGEGHAWVALFEDNKEYLLESTSKASRRRFPLASLHPEYIPYFMFNRDDFWVIESQNQGGWNRFASRRWIRLSAFREGV
jgi:hypothetical protein